MTTAQTGTGGRHGSADDPTGQALLTAVQNLTRVVEVLQQTLKEDYPKRSEIEKDFPTKASLVKSRKQAALIIAVAIFASSIITMGSVSYCFLQGKVYTACRVIPGYSATVDRSVRLAKQRDDSTTQVKRDALLLKQQEARIKKLELKVGGP